MNSLKYIYLRIIALQAMIWIFMLLLFYFFGGFDAAPRCYFVHPSYLVLFGLFLPFSLVFGWTIYKTNQLKWGRANTMGISTSYMTIQLLLMSLVWYALVIAAAMPIYGKEKAISSKSNLELIICLDISKSMNVKDMEGSSRLDVAKRVISSLLSKSSGEQIGLCIFAGAIIHGCFNVESELIEQQGTDIAAAFQQAKEMFSSNVINKSVLMITDGENHESDNQDSDIYKEILSKDIKTCIVGLGSSSGGPIPSRSTDNDATNLIDDNGNEWISKLDLESIKQLATSTAGSAIISSEAYPDIEAILTQINLMKRENSRTLDVDVEAMRYKWFVYAALIAFCTLLLLPVIWKK
ncbi:MAG: VWA domain-containing protein [Flavobacteriales bacterium]|nr:VWA domain-containing protein [Flavobacteriales bacterium]